MTTWNRPRRASLAAVLVPVVLSGACSPGTDPAAEPSGTAHGASAGPELLEGTGGAAQATPTRTTSAAPTTATERLAPPGELAATLPADRWTAGVAAPQALTEVAAAGFAGDLWVAGGLSESGAAVADVMVFSPESATWSPGPALPEAVHHAALVSSGDALHLIGGYEGAGFGRPSRWVWELTAELGEWMPAVPLPHPRAAGAAAWDGERVVYGGGVGPGGVLGEVYARVDGTWQVLGTLSSPREHLGAASDGLGRVWFLGGRVGGLDGNLATIDLVEGSGVRRVGELATPRGGGVGFYVPGAGACLAGGEHPGGVFDVVECIAADGAVESLAPLALARHGLGAAVVEGVAYAALGGDAPGLHPTAALELLALVPDG